jgi:hypothetical protein
MTYAEINNLHLQTMRHEFKKYYSARIVASPRFIEILRNHNFTSKESLDAVLNAYCGIVLTKSVRAAIFITLPELAPIKSLQLQHSIARGMSKKHLIEEFTSHGGPVCPKWYLDALARFDVPKQEHP